AAARQNQRIEALAVGQVQGADNLRRGIATLYGGGDQRQLHVRRAAAEHRDDVADHRAARRADDADALRMGGQGALAFGGEQTFGGQLGFQRLESQAQGTVAGGLDVVEDQDRKSTRLNSSHVKISYAVFCLKKKKNDTRNL